MTTLSYKLTLNDTEAIALTEAIDFYARYCRQQLTAGAQAPYWSHQDSLENIRNRLCGETTITSQYRPKGR